jgi:uncharacterized protein
LRSLFGARVTGFRRALAGLLPALCLLACEPAAPAPAVVPSELSSRAVPAGPVFAWQAEVGESTFHLLGSVHVAKPDLYPLDARIEGAFAESDVLVLELVLDEAAQLEAAQRMMMLGRLPAGKRLNDVVAPETWELLVRRQSERNLPLFGLRGFRPWFVALTVTTQALEREGFSSEHGIDEHFRRAAAERNQRVEPLETLDSQLALFTSLTPEAEEQMLRQTLEDLDSYASELSAAFRLWSAGDAAGVDELLVAPMQKEYPALFKQLFADRNRAMVERMLELAKVPGHYFVVVGAGHLVGSSGIVALLGSRGIPARQL